MSEHLADLTSHRIEGITIMGNTPFSVPLITYVGQYGNAKLYQGGCRNGVPVDFDVVLSLYPWERFDVPDTTVRMELPLYDSLGEIPDAYLDWAADQIWFFLQRGQDVLVHCQAGLNRSSLVVAHYLMRHEGATADEAIAIVRKRSEACLCNPDFEAWLRR